MLVIDHFGGEYEFLSNFWPSQVTLGGVVYPSVEHAYQAAKTDNIAFRETIRNAPSAGAAKKLGRKITIDGNWTVRKEIVMLDLLRQKFSYGRRLSECLLATGEADLIEGNWWNDRYWGVCKGEGLNRLGFLLMQVRDELQLIARGV